MKIFFDCGTHYFQGLKKFKQKLNIDKEWKIFCFEANPHTYNISKKHILDLQDLNITHLNKAVYVSNELININCALEQGTNPVSQASNILKNPPNVDIVYHQRHSYINEEVEAINFSDFIKNNTSPDDEVYIKMDIEGAEFEVLEKIINDETYKNFKQIYIEFHERFFFAEMDKKAKQKQDFLSFFRNKNIVAEEWE